MNARPLIIACILLVIVDFVLFLCCRKNETFDEESPQLSSIAAHEICVNEHLGGSNVVQFTSQINNEDIKNNILHEKYNKGSICIHELDEVMKPYELNRDKYEFYSNFYPEFLNCVKDLNKWNEAD